MLVGMRRVLAGEPQGDPERGLSCRLQGVDARPLLMPVPNVSEGRDLVTLEAIGQLCPLRAFLMHADPDHGRAVFTLTAPQGEMAEALFNGARSAVARIDISAHTGIHRTSAHST